MDEVFCATRDFSIVSGGQSGADRAALDWAIEQGIRHRGWCPSGRRAEDGRLPERYQLQETPSPGYLQRTEWNVRDSDATLIFTLHDRLDGGSRRTALFAEKLGKPCLHVQPEAHLAYVTRFLVRHGVKTLNVAGKRESVAPGIGQLVRQVLSQAVRIDPTRHQ